MAKGRGGLGRGLESLFEDAAPSFESDTRIETLPLREIEPDPGQPRKTFDDETLAELSASIAEHGLLQPIAVRPKPSGGHSESAFFRCHRRGPPAPAGMSGTVCRSVSPFGWEMAEFVNFFLEELLFSSLMVR